MSDLTTIACLTVWEPWATCIACGLKPVENRTWTPRAGVLAPGDPLVIHAGLRSDRDAHQFIRDTVGREAANRAITQQRNGEIVAVVTFLGVDWIMCTEWDAPNQAHWRLADPVRPRDTDHLYLRGQQGIFFIDTTGPDCPDGLSELIATWEEHHEGHEASAV